MAAAATKPPAAVCALVGEDSFLHLQALRAILDQLPPDAARVDIDGTSAEPAAVFDELRSLAMFGGAKLVVVAHADRFISDHRALLESYVAAPSRGSVLVLRCASLPKNQRIHKLIDKLGGIVPCEPPSLRAAPAWAVRRAREAHDLAVEQDAAQALVEQIGADLGRLDQELARLALQVDGRLTLADVQRLVAFQREQEMWEMTEAMTQGRAADAIRRWRRLLQTDSSAEFRATTWLTLWLERLAIAADLAQRRAPESDWRAELRVPPFQHAALRAAAQRLGAARLAAGMRRLADIDRRAKSGLGDLPGGVERFIIEFA